MNFSQQLRGKMFNIVMAILQFFLRAIANLPYPILYKLGGLLAWVNYRLNSRYRRYLQENLAIAYLYQHPGESLACPQFQQLLNHSIKQSGIQALELIQTWFGNNAINFHRIIKISGEDLITQHQGSILFLSAHLGNFELSGRYLGQQAATVVLFRPPRQQIVRKIVEAGRSFAQMQLVPTDKSGVRAMIKALRSNGRVALLPDQVPQFGEGIWSTFFGKPAWTMSLAGRLSEVADLTLFLRMERLENAQGYHLHIEPAVTALSGDTEQRCNIINLTMQQQIWQNPSQYLWAYNRYKVPAGVSKPHNESDNLNEGE